MSMPSGMTGRHHPLQMLAPESRRGAMVTLLLAHEATDIIEFAVDLCEDIVTVLLLHGSLVNSPFYNGGTLLSQGIAMAFRHPQLNWLPRLLSEYGGCLDPVFPGSDGLVDSFVNDLWNTVLEKATWICCRMPGHSELK
ncbi:hypothetical protein M422DRAFT_259156 [Sphaerobolus stellatus SS14]|uniref:Uncharacterized protein n=1 Tax=Sphaerobolus stellatus (strain SS14) TaxID=990650 RepID=A0A0C9VL13_SPHS4|nr:hypothetical protein M422DRAFT_259156 [Sphaerobolus stellatus SS14]